MFCFALFFFSKVKVELTTQPGQSQRTGGRGGVLSDAAGRGVELLDMTCY